MNRDQLLAIAPVGARADIFIGPLNASMDRFSIATPAAQACFTAQALYESMNFTRMSENLNYSPAGLMATFNNKKVTRFDQAAAARYGRVEGQPANQQMIANIAYANRMGNGYIESGDGFRYRGRGIFQLTGADNYRACGEALGIDLITSPDLVSQPDIGCLAAGWFWSVGNPTGKNLTLLADNGRFDDISRAINGGENGLAERVGLTMRALQVLS